MIIGCISDTHEIDRAVIGEVIEEFKRRGVEIVAHMGDIIPEHVDPELFGGYPVICVLTKEQAFNPAFFMAPCNWHFVRPAYYKDQPSMGGHFADQEAEKKVRELEEFCMQMRIFARLVRFGDIVAYFGHERSFELFCNPQKVRDFFSELNQVRDGVYLAMTGHMHHQFLFQNNGITWLNPGAVERSWNSSYEFAVYDTKKGEAVFARLSSQESKLKPVSVGIVSDTANVSELDSGFWCRLVKEFQDRGVTNVICCGDFRTTDIGRPELSNFHVSYYLPPHTLDCQVKQANWHRLDIEEPIIEIGGHRFYVQHGIGPEQADFSEIQRDQAFHGLLTKHGRLDFIVAGLVPDTIFQEGQHYSFVNPGDARDHKRYACICLPRREYTFGTAK